MAKQLGISADVLRSVVQQLKSMGESADPLAGAIQHLQQVKQAQASKSETASSKEASAAAATADAKRREESFKQVAQQVGVEPTTLRKALHSAIEEASSSGQSDSDASRIIGSAAQQLGVDPSALLSAIQQHDANLVSQYA